MGMCLKAYRLLPALFHIDPDSVESRNHSRIAIISGTRRLSSCVQGELGYTPCGMTPRAVHPQLVMLLVALALLVKAAVPVGWMPFTEDGVTRITLCTGYGMVEAWLDEDGNLHQEAPDDGDHQGKDQPCSFAAAATAMHGVAGNGDAAAPVSVALRPDLARPPAAPGRGLAAPPPPATGPPLLI